MSKEYYCIKLFDERHECSRSLVVEVSAVLFFSGPNHDSKFDECCDKFTGDAKRIESGDEDNYSQVTTFWNKVSCLRICNL